MAVVKGEARWASIQAPNTKFTPQWCIDLVVDKATAKKLKAEGLSVKENDDGELIVKFKRNTKKKDGSEKPAPKVVGPNKEPFTELVGNGSIVNVQYKTYEWEFAGKGGVAADLCAVQVLEYKPYAGSDGAEFDAVGEDAASAVELSDEDPFSDE